MTLLKEDGSLNVEWINKLPYEEYMNTMGNLTQEQVEEYLSNSPINESHEPIKVRMVDYTLEEDIKRNGAVVFEDFLNKIKKNYG